MRDKEDREKAVEKFFNLQKKALYDIVPRGKDHVVDLPPSTSENDERGQIPKRRISYYKKSNPKKWVIIFAVALVLFGSAVFAAKALPTALIVITLKQTPKEFQGQIKAAINGGDIPLQVFSETKNAQLDFPASGKEKVSRKAHGVISVCNAFNSSPQQLVATTRFESPDGLVFRADKGFSVPGALIKDGKIEPQCVNASVSADKTGVAYNIGPVTKWTIPGFKGGPRYEGFYGVSDKPMTGGFVGEAAVPTSKDIESAKAAARKKIEEIIQTAIEVRAPKDLTVLPSSSGFVVTKETLISETDQGGNFHYFIEAKDERMAIRKTDIENFFVDMVKKELGEDIKLASSKIDFTVKSKKAGESGSVKEAALDVVIRGGFVTNIKEEDIRSKAAGKSEVELRSLFAGDSIQSAKISLWPFWVKSVPKKTSKITVKIDIGPLVEEPDEVVLESAALKNP